MQYIQYNTVENRIDMEICSHVTVVNIILYSEGNINKDYSAFPKSLKLKKKLNITSLL